MVAVTTPTNTNSSVDFIQYADILNNASIIVSSNTMVELMVYDNRNYTKSLIHIFNNHATSGLTYNIYGTNDYNAGVYPSFSITTWKKLLTSDKALAGFTNDAETLTDSWAWVAVVMKQTVVDTGSAAIIRIRALK